MLLTVLALLLQTAAPPPRQAPTPEQIARMKEIYQPSAPHEALARLAGDWTVETAYASGGAPLRTTGRVTNRAILGGRFVVSEGRVRQIDGALDVESMLVFGFDGRTRQHTVIVLDTLGTYYVTAAGQASDEGRRILMRGETMEGQTLKKFDVTLEWIDDQSYRTEIIFHFPGRDPVIAVSSVHRRVAATSVRP